VESANYSTTKLADGDAAAAVTCLTRSPEHGAIQAAYVLNSPRTVEMSLYVVRAFVQLRELLASNKDLARRLDQLEVRIREEACHTRRCYRRHALGHPTTHEPPAPKRRGIGFTADLDKP
jgi:hypothetical protein